MSPITRCLRLQSPIRQLVRHASGGRVVGQRVVHEQKVVAPRPSHGKGTELSATPLKATYEPSPIFGAVKRPSEEPLTKSLPEWEKFKGKAKKMAPVKEGPKKPLTEDEKKYIYKSFQLKSSVKKMGNLTRQIAHKDIDFVITQMRFSPKRVARNILRGLEHAKEEAVKLQEMRDGQIIIDQAWVGRGTYKKQMWPRARGRMNVRMRPMTHFTVMLRSAETVAKQVAKVKQRKLESLVRTQKETRPIYNARPYYTW